MKRCRTSAGRFPPYTETSKISLYNTDLAMGQNVSEEKLVRINNIVQELAKATLVLGSTVTEEDR